MLNIHKIVYDESLHSTLQANARVKTQVALLQAGRESRILK